MLMSQHVILPTHKDGNILDLVFTNNDNLIHECSTIPVLQSTSHHDIVMVSTCFKVNNLNDEEQPKIEPRTGFNALNFFSDDTDWKRTKQFLN